MSKTFVRTHKHAGMLQSWYHDSRVTGVLLLVCTCLSLVVSNTFAGASYLHFWHMQLPGLQYLSLPDTPLHFINDVLMSVFFFMAGMEIKGEALTGALASPKRMALPAFGAIGGMAVPALLFSVFNFGGAGSNGWGIPTATDIAFSLGIASLLKEKVPASLRVFLTGLAIIDDLGAILIIAIFYGGSIKLLYLLAAAVLLFIIYILNRSLKQFGWLQLIAGILLWYAIYRSGIHPTVAGVLLAMMVPVDLLDPYENALKPYVNFIILPVFALANTAILFPGQITEALNNPVTWGIITGLVIGKPAGICLACYATVKLHIAALPVAVNWRQLVGAGLLAGIGFTMSIFISTLAFTEEGMQDISKLAVLMASLVAMIAGYAWLRFSKPFSGRRYMQ